MLVVKKRCGCVSVEYGSTRLYVPDGYANCVHSTTRPFLSDLTLALNDFVFFAGVAQ
jgi:hypothetical protein